MPFLFREGEGLFLGTTCFLLRNDMTARAYFDEFVLERLLPKEVPPYDSGDVQKKKMSIYLEKRGTQVVIAGEQELRETFQTSMKEFLSREQYSTVLDPVRITLSLDEGCFGGTIETYAFRGEPATGKENIVLINKRFVDYIEQSGDRRGVWMQNGSETGLFGYVVGGRCTPPVDSASEGKSMQEGGIVQACIAGMNPEDINKTEGLRQLVLDEMARKKDAREKEEHHTS